jgi:hypothetical protein
MTGFRIYSQENAVSRHVMIGQDTGIGQLSVGGCSPVHCIHVTCRAQTASCTKGKKGCFLEGQATGALSWSFPTSPPCGKDIKITWFYTSFIHTYRVQELN